MGIALTALPIYVSRLQRSTIQCAHTQPLRAGLRMLRAFGAQTAQARKPVPQKQNKRSLDSARQSGLRSG